MRLPSGLTRPRVATAAGRRVIAVDGEGNDIDGRHAYTLLCAADDRGKIRRHVAHDGTRRPADDDRQANHGLSTKACLDFLLSLPQSPTDLVVAFSFTYDAVKIIADLPLANLLELSATETTDWEGYRIEFRPRKFFTVAQPRYGKIKAYAPDGKVITRFRRMVNVYDAFGYFQMSFVNALRKTSRDVFTDTEWATVDEIDDMKARRSQFEDEDPARILAYCYSEVTMLAKLMRQVITSTEDMGIYPKSFHGSSAIAAQWMRDRKITNRRGGHIADPGVPEHAVYGAYFGGRFETTHIGRLGDCHAYDINSAYPAVARRLPCLAHATARQVTEFEPGQLGVYLVGSATSGDWAPFPIRIDGDTARTHSIPYDRGDREGLSKRLKALVNRQVLFAHGGRRWVWQDELAAARRHFGDDAIPVFDGWVIEPGCDHQPFAEIDTLYAQRQGFVRVGDGRQMVIKLLVNSLYGKTAQHVGTMRARGVTPDQVARAQRDAYRRGVEFDPVALGLVDPPDTLCVIWAGMITSGCRAQILDAVYRSGSVVSIATDGIIATEPIPGLAHPEKVLGEWEYGAYSDLSIYQNGVYTYTEDGKPKMKSRGFSPRDITADMLSEAWDSGVWDVYPTDGARGFIPLRQAMGRIDKLGLMGQWVPQSQPVSFTPSKRHFPPEFWYGDRPKVMPTVAYTLDDSAMSLPYVPNQTWADVLELDGFAGDGFDDTDAPEIV